MSAHGASVGLPGDDPGHDSEEYCFGDLCVGHVVPRGSGRQRLALESGLGPMSAVGNRAERKRAAALSVLG